MSSRKKKPGKRPIKQTPTQQSTASTSSVLTLPNVQQGGDADSTPQTKTKRPSTLLDTTSSAEKKTPATTPGSPRPLTQGKAQAGAAQAAAAQAAAQRKAQVRTAADQLPGLANLGVDGDYLAAGDLAVYADQHNTATTTLAGILAKEQVTDADRDTADRLLTELRSAAETLQQRADAAKKESDSLHIEINEQATRLPDPAGLADQDVYLDPGDLKAFRDAHNTITIDVETRKDRKRVTTADRDDTTRQVEQQVKNGIALQAKAAEAKTESDNFRKQVSKQLADFPDVLTQITGRAAFLDGDEASTFQQSHSTVAQALTTTAAAPRVTTIARDAALNAAKKVIDAATDLEKKAASRKVVSDGLRKQIQNRATKLPQLLKDVLAVGAYLSDADLKGFTDQHAQSTTLMTNDAAETRVTDAMLTAAEQRFQQLATDATELEKKSAPLKSRHDAVTKTVAEVNQTLKKGGRITDFKTLTTKRAAATTALREKAFDEFDIALVGVTDEAAKLRAYDEAIDEAQDRITALPQGDRLGLQSVRQKLIQAVRADPLVYATADQAVKDFDKAVQDILDREAAKAATGAAAAAAHALRMQKRADGLLPNNGAYEIGTSTRTTVGATAAERAAVVEALNALKDDTLPHTWAARWGVYHGNGEGNLPGIRGLGGYKEYYVRAATPAQNIRRLVVSDTTGHVYYSPNHYGSVGGLGHPFVKVTDP